MQYEVQRVDDTALPDGIDYVVVERCDGLPPLLFISGLPARCWQMMCDYQNILDASGHGGAQVVWPAERLLRAV